MSRDSEQQEVLRAAAAIIDAYQATDAGRYFPCFADDATFCFHTEPARLEDRRAYEEALGRVDRERMARPIV